MKLLLLEDDPTLGRTLAKYLKLNSHDVDWVKNGEEALELSYANSYDLYLFDINVPLIDGIDLLKMLRDADDYTPAIIISALVDVPSMTRGFRAGADDYIKKPFEPEELLIRIEARTPTKESRVKFKDFEIDSIKETVYYKGEIVNLGSVRKKLFMILVERAPDVVTFDELMWCLDKPTNLALRVHIAKLNRDLDIDIQSVRGIGYKVI